ncbi:hypothetical protein [Pseudarthrobacter sp. PvP090]|uniref:hypothetical protein n=1 Tax=Pseudarthrobacter sp. PvP090 TaxID=3156393 RepID=UPI003390F8DB
MKLPLSARDPMGWLPGMRVWTPQDHQSSITDFDLVSLGHAEVPGYLAARVGGYYVESAPTTAGMPASPDPAC